MMDCAVVIGPAGLTLQWWLGLGTGACLGGLGALVGGFAKPRIHHPATQGGPVSLWRWAKYHVGSRLADTGRRWEMSALHPDRDDDIPF